VSHDDVGEIKQLKYRYLRTLDLKRWDEFAECFVPEATGDYAGLTFEDRDALVGYMRENLGPGVISMHHAHHPEITLDDWGGDWATGVWYLEDRIIVPELDFVLEGAAFYTDRYTRTTNGWRIAHTGYERTFEVSMSTADLASYEIKRGRAYDAPDAG
jgi:hypothetical protein